jgi:beta-lactam-binding protein with PASTA domain
VAHAKCEGQKDTVELDLIGLTLEEALEEIKKAGVRDVEVVCTKPPNRTPQSDVIRVVAQRKREGKLVLVTSSEAYVQPYRRYRGQKH